MTHLSTAGFTLSVNDIQPNSTTVTLDFCPPSAQVTTTTTSARTASTPCDTHINITGRTLEYNIAINGIYELDPGKLFNSRPHYIQQSKKHVLYWLSEHSVWAIGGALGELTINAYAETDVPSPAEIQTDFLVFNGHTTGGWLSDPNVNALCFSDSPPPTTPTTTVPPLTESPTPSQTVDNTATSAGVGDADSDRNTFLIALFVTMATLLIAIVVVVNMRRSKSTHSTVYTVDDRSEIKLFTPVKRDPTTPRQSPPDHEALEVTPDKPHAMATVSNVVIAQRRLSTLVDPIAHTAPGDRPAISDPTSSSDDEYLTDLGSDVILESVNHTVGSVGTE